MHQYVSTYIVILNWTQAPFLLVKMEEEEVFFDQQRDYQNFMTKNHVGQGLK